MKNKSGFTLIELIIVIAVIGIMAAVAVPKFFDVQTSAHTANKQAVSGNLRTGLQNYAAQQLAQTGSRFFPAGLTLANLLDEIPSGWTASAGSILSYDGDNTTYSYTAVNSGMSGAYTLTSP